MCTCITYDNGGFYFGRSLDLDGSFGETVTVTPRNYSLLFRRAGRLERHYAMIGMAAEQERFPLYAEAVNEKGLCMAGLNFPGNAYYQESGGEGLELASFEVIPWLLGKHVSVAEAEESLREMRIVDLAFSDQMPPAPLHWMLADRERCLVLEAVREGLKVYENPFGVLTNNPPFEYHRMNMDHYLNLTAASPQNRFSDRLDLKPCSQGMGAVGLPVFTGFKGGIGALAGNTGGYIIGFIFTALIVGLAVDLFGRKTSVLFIILLPSSSV